MTNNELAAIKFRLVSALTQWDEKESKKKFYNWNALGIYMQRADDIILDIQMGADVRAAIVAGLTGRIVDFVLKKLALPITTKEEQMGSGIYKPVSKEHPQE